MVKKGNKFSKRINYDAIENLFGSPASSTNGVVANNGKLWSFDKSRDGSLDLDRAQSQSREYLYNERHEQEEDPDPDADADGEFVQIIEEEGGGVGFGKPKQQRLGERMASISTSTGIGVGAVSERTFDAAEDEDHDDGDDLLEHRGDISYGEYNYDESYEQEV